MMKKLLLEHKIIFSFAVFLISFVLTAIIVFMQGQEYSIYVEHSGAEVVSTDVRFVDNNLENIDSTDDYKLTKSNIIEITSIETNSEYTKFSFKAIGEGTVLIYATCHFDVSNDWISSSCTGEFYVDDHNQMFLYDSKNENKTELKKYVGFPYIVFGIIGFSVIMFIYSLFIVKNEFKTNKFSYKTMSYCGMSIFFFILFTIFSILMVRSFSMIHGIDLQMFLDAIKDVSMYCTLILSPLVLLFALPLTVSNIFLIKHEGKRLANILGIIISIVMILGTFISIALYIINFYYYEESVVFSIIRSIVTSFFVLFECLLMGTIICGIQCAINKPKYDKDFIIILGCGIRKDGTLLPLLRGRADKAISFYKEQLEKTGKKAYFVPSGGQGSDEIISEGEAIKRYLVECGIPEEQILPETKSTSTFENMKFSKEIIDSKKENAKVLFSTTNYHVFRSGMFSVEAGLNADGIGSKTKWYFWPNAFIREFIGLLAVHPKKQLLFSIIFTIIAGLGGYICSILFM